MLHSITSIRLSGRTKTMHCIFSSRSLFLEPQHNIQHQALFFQIDIYSSAHKNYFWNISFKIVFIVKKSFICFNNHLHNKCINQFVNIYQPRLFLRSIKKISSCCAHICVGKRLLNVAVKISSTESRSKSAKRSKETHVLIG